MFKGGINVPFIARWPGKIAAGKVDTTSMISAVDPSPTRLSNKISPINNPTSSRD